VLSASLDIPKIYAAFWSRAKPPWLGFSLFREEETQDSTLYEIYSCVHFAQMSSCKYFAKILSLLLQHAHSSSQWNPFIETACSLSYNEYSHPQLGRTCWLKVWVKVYPTMVQLYRERATTLSREMPPTSRVNRLAFLTSQCLFPVSDVMLKFPITSLWQNCPLCVAFQASQSKNIHTDA